MIGEWRPGSSPPAFAGPELVEAARRIREPLYVVRDPNTLRLGVAVGGTTRAIHAAESAGSFSLCSILPPIHPEWLGDRAFCEAHKLRFPYVVGEMANGIATTRLVIATARAGALGFFGAAGLDRTRVEAAIDELDRALGARAAWGINLIHSPNESALEESVADMLIARRVQRVCASAFMSLTPAVVRYAATGLFTTPDGQIARRNHLFAKLSRAELARHFLSPAPAALLAALCERGQLTRRESELARHVPVAADVTVEADSGGHTDNQALTALLPTVAALRDELTAQHRYRQPPRIGAAGGLGTPNAIAAAFAMGASYVVTGSINQATIEAGLSMAAKQMLARAEPSDVAMAAAADMFELGVRVQVLKRGTMFAQRANKLYDVYREYAALEAIPAAVRTRLEREVLRASFEDVWRDTKQFWQRRNPAEIGRAERDGKHKMALVFRWYLGQSSRWAIDGETARQTDFQIWCGPAMGAFNVWTRESYLGNPENRHVDQLVFNLLEGAATVTRAQQVRAAGVALPPEAFVFKPRPWNTSGPSAAEPRTGRD